MNTGNLSPGQRRAIDALLFAKFCRLFCDSGIKDFTRNFIPDYERTTLISNVTRDGSGRLESVSGYFRAQRGFTIFPFILPFSDYSAACVPLTDLRRLAFSSRTIPHQRIHTFLSILDHAISIGEAPPEAMDANVDRVTRYGTNKERIEYVNEYAAFCERARQSLPWDTANDILDLEMRGKVKAAA